ncbi:hypothetical protein F2Q68_00044804 [Brassica cretica]|uniref:Uncharacterized protein n=2 Tax=Brassica cretica TaxID=69181 RepID=A0A8S9LS76_BRACR|nr:hypothetical protein F2Q68_00044804 [Brassica cretica]KAF3516054.1 hypothetical protein DY000_02061182 [Brassica cretica]
MQAALREREQAEIVLGQDMNRLNLGSGRKAPSGGEIVETGRREDDEITENYQHIDLLGNMVRMLKTMPSGPPRYFIHDIVDEEVDVFAIGEGVLLLEVGTSPRDVDTAS